MVIRVLLAWGALTPLQAHALQTPPKTGVIVSRSLASDALANNTLGLPAAGMFEVYLPPSYESDEERRFPVLYLLHGIGGTSRDWTAQGTTIQHVMDERIAAGSVPEFLVVMPTAMTTFGGSFYVNSPVNGRWEDYLALELVPYIDEQFRTKPDRMARGIAGHSMGGYGALRLALDHPELFAQVLALSPACLDVIDDLGPSNPAWAEIAGYRDVPALLEQARKGNVYPMSLLAVAAAFSPDLGGSPFPVDLPFHEGPNGIEAEPGPLARWKASAIVPSVTSHVAALRRLRLLYVDYGFVDRFPHIPDGVEELHRILVDQHVPHIVEGYEGTHNSELWARLASRVLPLFGDSLPPP